MSISYSRVTARASQMGSWNDASNKPKASETSDGWDSSWDDNWDSSDWEGAPKPTRVSTTATVAVPRRAVPQGNLRGRITGMGSRPQKYFGTRIAFRAMAALIFVALIFFSYGANFSRLFWRQDHPDPRFGGSLPPTVIKLSPSPATVTVQPTHTTTATATTATTSFGGSRVFEDPGTPHVWMRPGGDDQWIAGNAVGGAAPGTVTGASHSGQQNNEEEDDLVSVRTSVVTIGGKQVPVKTLRRKSELAREKAAATATTAEGSDADSGGGGALGSASRASSSRTPTGRRVTRSRQVATRGASVLAL
eukprot:jgi/Mesvir1/4413/Mv11911-RA.1